MFFSSSKMDKKRNIICLLLSNSIPLSVCCYQVIYAFRVNLHKNHSYLFIIDISLFFTEASSTVILFILNFNLLIYLIIYPSIVIKHNYLFIIDNSLSFRGALLFKSHPVIRFIETINVKNSCLFNIDILLSYPTL